MRLDSNHLRRRSTSPSVSSSPPPVPLSARQVNKTFAGTIGFCTGEPPTGSAPRCPWTTTSSGQGSLYGSVGDPGSEFMTPNSQVQRSLTLPNAATLAWALRQDQESCAAQVLQLRTPDQTGERPLKADATVQVNCVDDWLSRAVTNSKREEYGSGLDLHRRLERLQAKLQEVTLEVREVQDVANNLHVQSTVPSALGGTDEDSLAIASMSAAIRSDACDSTPLAAAAAAYEGGTGAATPAAYYRATGEEVTLSPCEDNDSRFRGRSADRGDASRRDIAPSRASADRCRPEQLATAGVDHILAPLPSSSEMQHRNFSGIDSLGGSMPSRQWKLAPQVDSS